MGDYAESWDETSRTALLRWPWPAVALAALACLIAVFALWREQTAVNAGRAGELHAQRVEHQLVLMSRAPTRTRRGCARRGASSSSATRVWRRSRSEC